MKKKYILFLLALLSNGDQAYCQNNYETAKAFMSKKGIQLSADTLNSRNDGGYDVFRAVDDRGYAVVKDHVIIAYSTEEPYSNYTFKPSTRALELTPKSPIMPMIEAKFIQNGSPYVDSLPLRRPVGCGALAVAKIMYYYKNQRCDALDEVKFENERIPDLEALPPTTFNWDNILPRYKKGQYTEEQGKEVAKLMKYVGYAVHSEYNMVATGSWVLPQWLRKLGFSDETYTTVGDEYEVGTDKWWQSYNDWIISDAELEALLDYELEQGRPVMIAGYNMTFTNSHWQIVDGRDDTGRYHINEIGYVIMSQEMCANNYAPPLDYAREINRCWCVVPIVSQSITGQKFENNGIRYKIGDNNTVSVVSRDANYAGAVSIPNQVAFNDNNYTVTSISSSAFEGCIDITSVTIPSSVTMIGDAAFYYCTGLTTVDIPNGVKTIGEGAFSKCGGLTSVTIPGSVTSIGKNAFFQCYGLTQITSGIETPFAIDDGVFPTSVYNNASLLVPSGKKSAYQNTAGWKRFQNIYYVDGVYTLTYYVDGVEYKSVTYSSGAGITPEAEPTKEGYTFSGWIDIPETMPDHDVTVTGTFTINQYTITYVIDGEEYATVTVDFNSKIVPLTPPSKDGFDFAWEEYPETMPAHDITINGAYTTTDILSIAVESGKAKIFTLDGRQVDTPQKGINIIRMDEGTIKKVVLGK